jgi:pimeloyl-ACP methyl ester carboxylesterase
MAAFLVISTTGALRALCQGASISGFQDTKALRRDGESHFVSIGGLRLQYVDWGGRGQTLIFIPGGCDTAFVFGDIASRLAQRFRVLGLTARGCGASDRPASGYDMSHQIGDISGFMNALNIQKCILIGHSSGGGKITQFAHKYPDRVDRLVYLDTVYGYIAPGLEEKINEQIERMLGGHPMDSVENWKGAAGFGSRGSTPLLWIGILRKTSSWKETARSKSGITWRLHGARRWTQT